MVGRMHGAQGFETMLDVGDLYGVDEAWKMIWKGRFVEEWALRDCWEDVLEEACSDKPRRKIGYLVLVV